jgi:hypothetical protein
MVANLLNIARNKLQVGCFLLATMQQTAISCNCCKRCSDLELQQRNTQYISNIRGGLLQSCNQVFGEVARLRRPLTISRTVPGVTGNRRAITAYLNPSACSFRISTISASDNTRRRCVGSLFIRANVLAPFARYCSRVAACSRQCFRLKLLDLVVPTGTLNSRKPLHPSREQCRRHTSNRVHEPLTRWYGSMPMYSKVRPSGVVKVCMLFSPKSATHAIRNCNACCAFCSSRKAVRCDKANHQRK